MKKIDAIFALKQLESFGACVFTRHDLEKFFPEESEKAFEKSLQRLVKDGILQRITKGVYLNCLASFKTSYLIEEIAKVVRKGFSSYVSLESMLSEYGLISQIPTRQITIMTTGPSGIYKTPFGVIEFTHTKRGRMDIFKNTRHIEGRPLRVATERAAKRDLLRVGRNVNMIEEAQ